MSTVYLIKLNRYDSSLIPDYNDHPSIPPFLILPPHLPPSISPYLAFFLIIYPSFPSFLLPFSDKL